MQDLGEPGISPYVSTRTPPRHCPYCKVAGRLTFTIGPEIIELCVFCGNVGTILPSGISGSGPSSIALSLLKLQGERATFRTRRSSEADTVELVGCPRCGMVSGDHPAAVRTYKGRPGVVDVGWSCRGCEYEWGFELS